MTIRSGSDRLTARSDRDRKRVKEQGAVKRAAKTGAAAKKVRPKKVAPKNQVRPASAVRPAKTKRTKPVRVKPRLTEAQRKARERNRRRLRGRLRLAAVTVVVGAVAFGVWQVPRMSIFNVERVQVEGAGAVSDLAVRMRIDELLASETIYTLDDQAVERRVEQLPFVQSVRVERHFPNGITVTVTEYAPLAIAVGRKSSWLVARDGRVLTRGRLEDWRDRIPVVKVQGSLKAGQSIGGASALRLLRAVPPTFPGSFTSVDRGRFGLTAKMQEGPEVRFGRDDALPEKLLVAERLLTMFRLGQRSSIEYIDVSVPSRPAVSGLDV